MSFPEWPAWRFSPDGASDVFFAPEDVPAGWEAHPATFSLPEVDADEVDVHGWPWTDTIHSPTQSKTSSGLWRMKPGASRPEPKPGYPVDDLDF